MPKLEFKGSFVALVTPFDEAGRVDIEGLRRLVRLHVAAGTDGLIALGSAGEAWTLSEEERELVIRTVVEEAQGRLPVVAGVTRVSTEEAIRAAKKAEALGADAVMAAPPPYVVPTQEGIYRHYSSLCAALGIGLVIYNVPYRTSVAVEPDTILRLMDRGLVAYKEAGKDVAKLIRVLELTEGRLPVLVCDAPAYGLIPTCLALGGKGTANITGNVAPRLMAQLSRPWSSWEGVEQSRELYIKLLPLMRLMYSETNPVAVKALMNLLGLPAGGVRPPLLPLSEEGLRAGIEGLMVRGILREVVTELERLGAELRELGGADP